MAGYARERGCAMVVLLNKWDLVEGPEQKEDIRERVSDRLTFVGYAPVIAIQANTGKNVLKVWDAIDKAYAAYCAHITTNRLNTWLAAIREFGHTASKGKRVLKLKYVSQTGDKPPRFTFFVNHPDLVDDNYERYLENRLRREFDLEGTPIFMKFKKRE